MYYRMDARARPTLSKSSCLTSASGSPIKELGKGHFDLKLGPLTLRTEAIVAEIEDEALLGMDVLQNGEGGPADILLSKGIIQLRGMSIPCIQVGLDDTARKVKMADDFTVPGYTEVVVDAFVSRYESDDLVEEKVFWSRAYKMRRNDFQ